MFSGVAETKSRTLYLLLREQIMSGVLAPGNRLSSEPVLAQEHGISRVTVRRALDALEGDGLIRRHAGAGTFVADQGKDKPLVADFANMLAHIVEMGRVTRAKLLNFSYVVPPASVAEALGLEPGVRTQHSTRVRYTDDLPFSYLTTYVPESIGVNWSEGELATRPLLALMERSGVKADRASQSVSAVLAGPDVAEALGVDVGSALLEVRRTVYDPQGRGVEYLHALYRPDRYLFRMDMSRITRGGEGHWRPVERLPDMPMTSRPRPPARTPHPSTSAKRKRGGSP
jgi:GntR family transcriptional regulator